MTVRTPLTLRAFGRRARGLWLLLILLLAACAPPAGAPVPQPTAVPAPAFPVTVTDDDGQTITIDKEPQRLITLAPSNTEIVYALGIGDRLVAVSDYSDYPPEAASKPKVGYIRVDIERVIGYNPDLILATGAHRQQVTPQLRQRGLKVITLDPKNIEGVFDNILLVGRATGQTTAAEKLVADLKARVAQIESKVRQTGTRPRVFFELDKSLFTVGPGSFIHDLIVRAGGENIAGDADRPYPQLSLEVLLQRDPEVIIITDIGQYGGETPESVRARPGWQSVSAVRNNRVVPINPDLVNRPGPRVVDGFEAIARALHPEAFR
jgi:iron complex transport system substrate-binding protein